MKIGIQPDIDHKPKEAFEFAEENGFTHLEILMDHPFYSAEALDYVELIELKSSYDVDVLLHAPAASTNFISTSDSIRKASYEELEKALNLAEKCEAELVTVHIGWNPGFITARGFVFHAKAYSKHNYKVLTEEFYQFAKIHGSLLSIENTIRLDENLTKAVEFLINNTDISLTFDIGHYNINKHEIFLKHFDRVKNVHLHDNDGKQDLHLALGRGNSNLDIIPKKYKNFFTIETRDVQSILESKDYLNNWIKKREKRGE